MSFNKLHINKNLGWVHIGSNEYIYVFIYIYRNISQNAFKANNIYCCLIALARLYIFKQLTEALGSIFVAT